MPTLVTLVYTFQLAPGASTAVQKTAVESYVVDPDVLAFLGLTPNSDATTNTATTIVRTIVLNITPAFLTQFPTHTTQIGALTNLFGNQIAAASRLSVTPSNPVIA